jgi:nucleoside-diphosphate-sugar epimerase
MLVRPESTARAPAGTALVTGNALDASTFATSIPRGATLVHLVGTPHPNPSKAAEFERVDLASIRASVEASVHAGVSHLVYVSVAQPAPAMHAYVAARAAGETTIRTAGLTATFVRPWYVLGPGHWWPVLLVPLYQLAEWLPNTRATAQRLRLVTLAQMVAALMSAIEHPPASDAARVVDVPAIRAST